MPRTLKRKTDNKTSGFGQGRQTRKRRMGTPGAREKTQCRFCRNGIKYIDYKDVGTLQKLLTNRGKIYSRKRSGNCAGCQRKAKKAIKRARYIAILPYSA
ncbi:MAG: 30S ribosomal protein S18 [Planctomycetota bacterium]